MRAKNLAALRFDRHFVRANTGAGPVTHLVLGAGETKNKAAMEFPVPAPVAALIEQYRTKFLPLLGPANSPFLFPARKGGSKDPGPFGVQLKRALRANAGIDLNLHAFRHLSAFLFLRQHPGEYETIRLLLGHKTITTTIQFYCGLEQDDAFRRYDAMLDGYRDSLPASGKAAGSAKGGRKRAA